MLNLTDSCGETAYAYAVTTHNRSMSISVGVRICHIHRCGIFCAELEYVSDLYTTAYANCFLSAAGAYAAGLYFGKVNIFYITDIALDIKTYIVIINLVCTAAKGRNSLE